MSTQTFAIQAQSRNDLGKGASRRLRRLNNRMPAIIYGNEMDPQSISLSHDEILKYSKHESFYSSILDLNVDGKTEKVVLKDIQRHPYKKLVMHIDFQRVSEKKAITMHVPLHFLNEDTAAGVKLGGVISHQMVEVEVKCLAKDLPEYIEVDMSQVDLEQIVHVSDLKLPSGVEITSAASNAVVSINKPKTKGSDAAEEEGSEEK